MTPSVLTRRTAPRWARWALLTAIIAGVFGMHVLTGEGDGGHGTLPIPISSSGELHHVMQRAVEAMAPDEMAGVMAAGVSAAAQPAGAVTSTPLGSDHSHSGMAECLLFLVIGGGVLLMLMAAHALLTVARTLVGAAAPIVAVFRRGPPGRILPRIALCVIRN